MLRQTLSLGSVVLGILVSWYLGQVGVVLGDREFLPPQEGVNLLYLILAGAGVGLVLGLAALAVLSWVRRFENKLDKIPAHVVLIGAGGLVLGLVIGDLAAFPFLRFPVLGAIIPPFLAMVGAYLGLRVALSKEKELLRMIPSRKGRPSPGIGHGSPKLLDTSAIIDGRVADIAEAGFLDGPLLVSRTVLEELQHIADSSDTLRRNRGRRGLEILNRLQKDLGAVEIHEDTLPFGGEVDAQLIHLAQELDVPVLTNDYNLNKVAEFQGVKVLNINELANALKPVVLPGEEMDVQVIRDGKEQGQGVGYLDDGTMIVVDGGRRHIGDTIGVIVTSVLQTSAGRMIFAKPKAQRQLG